MRKFAVLLVLAFFFISCERNNYLPVSVELKNGTYSGVKVIYYPAVDYHASDTISVVFDDQSYSYSGISALDYGRGSYKIKGDSIHMNDEDFRIALYSWDWILSGKYQIRLSGDSLILSRKNFTQVTTCRLLKISE
jgi:hypothetical protein